MLVILPMAVTLALLASLFHLAPAAGAQGVQNLSPAGADAGSAAVAVDATGRGAAVWTRWDGANYRIQLRRRSASGKLGPVKMLSGAGQTAQIPQVALDRSGNAFVVWERFDGANYRIQLRRHSAAGKLGPVQTLSPVGQYAGNAQIALDRSGNAIVVWQAYDGANSRIQLRRRSAAGKLGPVRTLSAAGQDALGAQIALDGKGHAHVVWARSDGTSTRIQLVRRAASGKLGPVRSISAAGGEAYSPQIAADANGHAYVVWSRWNGADARVQLRRRAASGKLGPVQGISGAGGEANWAQVAVDPKGNAFVVWERSDGVNPRIQLRRRSASGTLGAVQPLSPAGATAQQPQLGVDAKGRAMVVWSGSDGSNVRTRFRRRSATGSLGQVKTLSDAGADAEAPRTAVDAKGRTTVVWERWSGVSWRIQGTRVPAG